MSYRDHFGSSYRSYSPSRSYISTASSTSASPYSSLSTAYSNSYSPRSRVLPQNSYSGYASPSVTPSSRFYPSGYSSLYRDTSWSSYYTSTPSKNNWYDDYKPTIRARPSFSQECSPRTSRVPSLVPSPTPPSRRGSDANSGQGLLSRQRKTVKFIEPRRKDSIPLDLNKGRRPSEILLDLSIPLTEDAQSLENKKIGDTEEEVQNEENQEDEDLDNMPDDDGRHSRSRRKTSNAGDKKMKRVSIDITDVITEESPLIPQAEETPRRRVRPKTVEKSPEKDAVTSLKNNKLDSEAKPNNNSQTDISTPKTRRRRRETVDDVENNNNSTPTKAHISNKELSTESAINASQDSSKIQENVSTVDASQQGKPVVKDTMVSGKKESTDVKKEVVTEKHDKVSPNRKNVTGKPAKGVQIKEVIPEVVNEVKIDSSVQAKTEEQKKSSELIKKSEIKPTDTEVSTTVSTNEVATTKDAKKILKKPRDRSTESKSRESSSERLTTAVKPKADVDSSKVLTQIVEVVEPPPLQQVKFQKTKEVSPKPPAVDESPSDKNKAMLKKKFANESSLKIDKKDVTHAKSEPSSPMSLKGGETKETSKFKRAKSDLTGQTATKDTNLKKPVLSTNDATVTKIKESVEEKPDVQNKVLSASALEKREETCKEKSVPKDPMPKVKKSSENDSATNETTIGSQVKEPLRKEKSDVGPKTATDKKSKILTSASDSKVCKLQSETSTTDVDANVKKPTDGREATVVATEATKIVNETASKAKPLLRKEKSNVDNLKGNATHVAPNESQPTPDGVPSCNEVAKVGSDLSKPANNAAVVSTESEKVLEQKTVDPSNNKRYQRQKSNAELSKEKSKDDVVSHPSDDVKPVSEASEKEQNEKFKDKVSKDVTAEKSKQKTPLALTPATKKDEKPSAILPKSKNDSAIADSKITVSDLSTENKEAVKEDAEVPKAKDTQKELDSKKVNTAPTDVSLQSKTAANDSLQLKKVAEKDKVQKVAEVPTKKTDLDVTKKSKLKPIDAHLAEGAAQNAAVVDQSKVESQQTQNVELPPNTASPKQEPGKKPEKNEAVERNANAADKTVSKTPDLKPKGASGVDVKTKPAPTLKAIDKKMETALQPSEDTKSTPTTPTKITAKSPLGNAEPKTPEAKVPEETPKLNEKVPVPLESKMEGTKTTAPLAKAPKPEAPKRTKVGGDAASKDKTSSEVPATGQPISAVAVPNDVSGSKAMKIEAPATDSKDVASIPASLAGKQAPPTVIAEPSEKGKKEPKQTAPAASCQEEVAKLANTDAATPVSYKLITKKGLAKDEDSSGPSVISKNAVQKSGIGKESKEDSLAPKPATPVIGKPIKPQPDITDKKKEDAKVKDKATAQKPESSKDTIITNKKEVSSDVTKKDPTKPDAAPATKGKPNAVSEPAVKKSEIVPEPATEKVIKAQPGTDKAQVQMEKKSEPPPKAAPSDKASPKIAEKQSETPVPTKPGIADKKEGAIQKNKQPEVAAKVVDKTPVEKPNTEKEKTIEQPKVQVVSVDLEKDVKQYQVKDVKKPKAEKKAKGVPVPKDESSESTKTPISNESAVAAVEVKTEDSAAKDKPKPPPKPKKAAKAAEEAAKAATKNEAAEKEAIKSAAEAIKLKEPKTAEEPKAAEKSKTAEEPKAQAVVEPTVNQTQNQADVNLSNNLVKVETPESNVKLNDDTKSSDMPASNVVKSKPPKPCSVKDVQTKSVSMRDKSPHQFLALGAVSDVSKSTECMLDSRLTRAHNSERSIIERSATDELHRSKSLNDPPVIRYRKYNLMDFNLLKVLGKGSFGKVFLVELRDVPVYFAMKCLKKDVVLEDDDVECTLIERRVLSLGSHNPFICKLLCTFQTDSHLFFVMEFLKGGDLMFHVQNEGSFTEERTRFYAAEIVSALKFLHRRGIVYRDLKLDNVCLDGDGHIRLIDFGMCVLKIYRYQPTAFCGTPEYMAPEVINGIPYNHAVDWWSFGVVVYEMLRGRSPYTGCDEDELFWNVLNTSVEYPRYFTKEATDLIQLCLQHDPEERLGMPTCIAGDITKHAFFDGVDWDKVNTKQLQPLFKPSSQCANDVQYFDEDFTNEKPVLTPVEPDILAKMDQALFDEFSYTNPDMTA